MSKPLDLSKPLQLQRGDKVIGAMRLPDGRIMAAYSMAEYRSDALTCADIWSSDGTYTSGDPSELDIINVPVKHEMWLNIYFDGSRFEPYCYGTRNEADKNSSDHRIACVRVEFTEGEGL
jgi:hypothetical protein